jgi:hypothetical protein
VLEKGPLRQDFDSASDQVLRALKVARNQAVREPRRVRTEDLRVQAWELLIIAQLESRVTKAMLTVQTLKPFDPVRIGFPLKPALRSVESRRSLSSQVF